MDISGKVTALWRYPVKSMLGESCKEIVLEARGVAGDRQFAVQAANGKLGSGKDTRRFCKMDGLFALQAYFHDGVPTIQFPDGEHVVCDSPDINSALSTFLGQSVRLTRETDISHLDAGPFHIITRESLARLSGVAPEGIADARRFRPNIVLSTDSDHVEQKWLGRRVRIGEAELEFRAPTERCGMVTFAQSELTHAPQILRYIAQELDLCFGLYAEVVRPGLIRLDDEVKEV